jgi:hypothetical protein
MKKYTGIALITLLSVVAINSCKKNDTPKDYNASIKGKTWVGKFADPGKEPAYYSIYFNADNSLEWNQAGGNYPGLWVVNGRQLIINFVAAGVKITADIADNDTLMNITTNTVGFLVSSGKLLANPYLPLTNTVWKGAITKGNTSYPLQINFKPDLKVEVYMFGSQRAPYSYKRSESGAVIRFTIDATYTFFGVIISDNEMKGSEYAADYPWQATKQ